MSRGHRYLWSRCTNKSSGTQAVGIYWTLSPLVKRTYRHIVCAVPNCKWRWVKTGTWVLGCCIQSDQRCHELAPGVLEVALETSLVLVQYYGAKNRKECQVKPGLFF